MKDVMVDLESFGNGKNACICQIGACYFDRITGEIGATFKVNIDARSAVKSGAQIDADTVYFWLAQSKEAQDSITKDPLISIEDGMAQLNDFLAGAKNVWSHATFDFVIIQETFKRLDMKPKFHYRAARDIRTLIELANVTVSKTPRTGLHHDGLEDCKHQVKYCVEAFKKIAARQVQK